MIGGKFHGVQPFMVQLRDKKTHKLLPTIETGDIGPKFGFHTKDNGWLKFNNTRIPRTNLLRRYVDVDREGNFKKKGDLRNLYTVMMQTRMLLVYEGNLILLRSLTIAIRYSVVRRQFSSIDNDPNERKLLDYQT
mmetsp:Transcript_39599/g.38139  ORF Transcript_39599/g.38139 Transcript_39599/m.38139 type:complete len:135 (+) Transcript_39599:607-1011(+)